MCKSFQTGFSKVIIICTHIHILPIIVAIAGSLAIPIPFMVTADTMTTTVPVNTPSGSDGAVNVSVVVELLLKFIIVPLKDTRYPVISPCVKD